MTDKRTRRRESFATIRTLSDDDKHSASVAICRRIADTKEFREADTVFAYLSLPSEPSLGNLIGTYSQKRWGFSRIDENDLLRFHHVTALSQVAAGDFGISEPDPSLCNELGPQEADLILVPGVAFDPENNARLGRGRGHYDRFLATALKSPESPTIFGVCFSAQLTALTPEDHDIPMGSIITEVGES